ncbi:MAG: alpha/beta fold hydrolase [Christensenellaceae bacterium]
MTFDLSEVSFIQKGTGRDLVFFHGYLSSKESFTAQIEYFSRFYRVTAFDFLGFGQSAPLNEAFSVSDYAEWTKALLDALKIERPHVVAHSFGCRVAVKMAKGDGQVFDKMLLTGPAGVILKRGFGYKLKVKAYRLVKKFAPNYAEKHFGSTEYRSLPPVMRESYKKIVNEDLRADAREISNEVLMVVGEEDKTTPIEEAEAYLVCLENGWIKRMEGGHFAFAEHPLAFNLIAEEFFFHE